MIIKGGVNKRGWNIGKKSKIFKNILGKGVKCSFGGELSSEIYMFSSLKLFFIEKIEI